MHMLLKVERQYLCGKGLFRLYQYDPHLHNSIATHQFDSTISIMMFQWEHLKLIHVVHVEAIACYIGCN
jgi:hypothetical protein